MPYTVADIKRMIDVEIASQLGTAGRSIAASAGQHDEDAEFAEVSRAMGWTSAAGAVQASAEDSEFTEAVERLGLRSRAPLATPGSRFGVTIG